MDWTKADRMGVKLVAPGLLQRGQFLTWPHARKWQMIEDLGIGLVINLWLKTDPDLSGLSYINMPMPGDEVPKNAEHIAHLAAHWTGGAVLVHCEAGVNRSAWFCARVLMAKGLSGEDAYQHVMQAVPRARIHATLKADLLRTMVRY